MKKLTSILLFASLIFTMTFYSPTIFSATANDNISNDSYIAQQYNNILSSAENQALNDKVLTCLELESFSYEIISGFASPNRFILVESNNCYLIYDRFMCDYVEYSTYGNSPYHNLSQNTIKLYLAPTFYYAISGESVIDLLTGVALSSAEIADLQLLETTVTNEWTVNKNNIIASQGSNEQKSSELPASAEVPYSYYLSNLTDNFGSNIKDTTLEGSCSYVANEILLSYYDTVKNDNIIAESYDVTEEETFTSYDSINCSVFSESPGINDVFHEDFIEYGTEFDSSIDTPNSINMEDTAQMLTQYFYERIGITISTHPISNQTNKVALCKEGIASGCPVLISIATSDGNHRVVGYKYTSNGIFVNYGHKSKPFPVNINSYTINNALYITFNANHVCSNNYAWSYNSCSGTVCPCGLKTCNHALRTTSQHNPLYHKLTCAACNNQLLQEHTFTTSGGMKTCTKCSYSIDASHTHNYVYSYVSMNRHRTTCSCGYSAMEGCVWMSAGPGDPEICAKCGHINE